MTDRARLTGSHLIARALKLEGVENVFTLAGDHILPALDVMADEGFRFYDTRHEQAAVHMADAWGRITGGPGVAMYTTPGFANAIPGLSNATHSESPLLSISGCAESLELGRGAMQEIDQVGMAAPTTKGAWMVPDARRIPDMIAHALRVAYGGRRGPVHLTIPVDVQQQSVYEDEVSYFAPSEYRGAPPAGVTAEQARRIVDLLRAAERPLIIAGSPAAYAETGEALQRFIETTKLPLMTEGDARGLVSDDHPYCFGFYDSGLNRAARLIREADLVMLLGRKQDLIVGYAQPPQIPAGAKVVQVDPSAAEIGRNRGVAEGVVGDVEPVIEQLAREAERHTWPTLPWLERLADEVDAQREQLEALAVAEMPMHALYVHKALRNHLREGDFVVYDGGDFCHFGRASTPALSPRSWFYVSTSGMLGPTLPTALAAKIANPGRRVVMLTGDGAFGFNGMEFDTAVRHNLAIVAIMGNDSAWGIDRQIQLGVYGKTVATDLLPTRYDLVARGLGAHGELVENPEELAPALERAFRLERPALVNVRVRGEVSPRGQSAIDRWTSEEVVPL